MFKWERGLSLNDDVFILILVGMQSSLDLHAYTYNAGVLHTQRMLRRAGSTLVCILVPFQYIPRSPCEGGSNASTTNPLAT